MVTVDAQSAIALIAISAINAIGLVAVSAINAVGLVAISPLGKRGRHHRGRRPECGRRHRHWEERQRSVCPVFFRMGRRRAHALAAPAGREGGGAV